MTKIASRDDVRRLRGIVDPIIVTRKGNIARLQSRLTPPEAQIEDLLFLRKALKRAVIPYLLIRDDKDRPILVVDIELRSVRDGFATLDASDRQRRITGYEETVGVPLFRTVS